MTSVSALALTALLLGSLNACAPSQKAEAAANSAASSAAPQSLSDAQPERAPAAADGTASSAAASESPSDARSEKADAQPETDGSEKSGSGHISLAGQYTLEHDFSVEGCAVAPPGDGLLSGYRMTAKDGTAPIGMLTITLKDYSKDGAYVAASRSSEAVAGQAMAGSMGPLTLMLLRKGNAPLAFMQMPASKLTITVTENGTKGSAEFSDLESQPSMEDLDLKSGKMPRGKRVSGSVTWTCGAVDHINAKMNDAINGGFKTLIPPR